MSGDLYGARALELFFELRCIHGLAEKEPLGTVAANLRQGGELVRCFHSLCDYEQSESVGQPNDSGDESI